MQHGAEWRSTEQHMQAWQRHMHKMRRLALHLDKRLRVVVRAWRSTCMYLNKAAEVAPLMMHKWYTCARALRCAKKTVLGDKLVLWRQITRIIRVASMMTQQQRQRSAQAINRTVVHLWRAHVRADRCWRAKSREALADSMLAWRIYQKVAHSDRQKSVSLALCAWLEAMATGAESANMMDSQASRKLMRKLCQAWHKMVVISRAVRIMCGEASAARALQAWRRSSLKQMQARALFIDALVKGKRRTFAAWIVYVQAEKEERALAWRMAMLLRQILKEWRQICQVSKVTPRP